MEISFFKKIKKRSHTLHPLKYNLKTPIKTNYNYGESDSTKDMINYKNNIKEIRINSCLNKDIAVLENINNELSTKLTLLKYNIKIEELKGIQSISNKIYRKENLKTGFQKSISSHKNNLFKELQSAKNELLANNLRLNQITDPNYLNYLNEKLRTLNEGISVLRKHNSKIESKNKWHLKRKSRLNNITRETRTELNIIQESNQEINKISSDIIEIQNKIQILIKNSSLYGEKIKVAESISNNFPCEDFKCQRAIDNNKLSNICKVLEGKKFKIISEINILKTKSDYVKKECLKQKKYIDGQIISIKNQIDLHEKY